MNRLKLRSSKFLLSVFLFLTTSSCFAHVGSPDVYFDGQAGPYRLLITVRPPAMIPGLAQIEVRSESPDVKGINVVPLYIVGEGSKYPPAADNLERSKDDPQFFSGQLWIMGSGSWQVRVTADGAEGSGMVSVPVPRVCHAHSDHAANLGMVSVRGHGGAGGSLRHDHGRGQP